jgi:hypothetical protein
VNVSFVTNTASGADGNDVLISVEGAIGSAFNDSFTGSTASVNIDAGDGNDTIL